MSARADAAAPLRAALRGDVLLPGEPGYDDARRVWNAMVDHYPAVIARCACTADVVEAIRFARRGGLEIGVRCGGHSITGAAVPHDGLMIDLRPMGGVHVDPQQQRAWVQGGALLGAMDRATQQYGLATTAGNVSHTGVGGLTLGGGMGWLARQYGLSCDNVESYELVTAAGDVLRVSADEHPDLFWGLRGGGGNFGVVTEFEFRLHRTGTSALVVEMYHGLDAAPAAMRGWRDLLEDAPRQATFTAWTGDGPTAPFLPAALHGQSLLNIGYVWVGDPDEGRDLLPALRSVGKPVAEQVQELSYLDLQTTDDAVLAHDVRRYWKGHLLSELADPAIDAFLSRGGDPERASEALPYASLQLYRGAIADVASADTAFSHRDTLVEFVAATPWTDPSLDSERIAAGRRYGAAVAPFAVGSYVNAFNDDQGSGVSQVYSTGHLARLVALKDAYDPDNVFHLNANIPPSTAGRSSEKGEVPAPAASPVPSQGPQQGS